MGGENFIMLGSSLRDGKMGKVWDSSCRRVRGCLQTVATQAEYGFFAHMQPLAQMKQMFEGSKVALQMQWPT